MEKGLIQVYSGEGHGKSAAALGRAIQVASAGEDVVIINFLKGYQNEAFLKRMEPEVKIFRFEKIFLQGLTLCRKNGYGKL